MLNMQSKELKNGGDNLVLLIEDEVALQEAATLKLERAGLRCVAVSTAEDGLLFLEQEQPGLIWLDLLLPGMGGFAFLQRLREHQTWKEIPVMIVSVSAGPEKIHRAFELNVVDYLVKSEYKLSDIVGRVENFLKKS
jgi:CheY-like chemotaxis protein